jgi:transposase
MTRATIVNCNTATIIDHRPDCNQVVLALEPMRKVARILRKHEDLLMNWFRAKGELSSGAVEGINNKIRVVTRRS